MSTHNKNKTIIGVLLSLLFIGIIVAVVFVVRNNQQPGKYDAFAQCLTENDVTYYGAFWCPNCQRQGNMFGKSKRYVNYIECSTPNRRDQKTICKEAEIEAYPTWEFADGSRVTGIQTFEFLAEQTGCTLPE